MAGIEAGQKVRIDVESVMEDGQYTVGSGWNDRKYIIGTVEGRSRFTATTFYEVSISPEENGISDSRKSVHSVDMEKKHMEPYRVCESCEVGEIYHDKRREWLCPFCDMDDRD